jgi:MYXO-CTERM domain-containing protein
MALLTSVLTLGAGSASAQRCVSPTDSDDRPGEHRYCGAPLITGLGGVAGFGNPAVAGQGCLARNDDGSSASLSLTPYFPAGLSFFGTTHTSAFLNTNGNITFSAALSTFTPSAFPVAARPMIAPFWADVDIRRFPVGGSCMGAAGTTCNPCNPCHNPDENGVWWHFTEGRAVFTWDRVGYYNCANDRRMSFQLILTAAPGCASAGDFDVEFRYNRCEWDTGAASGGTGGFLTSSFGQAAQAGFDAGNTRDYVEIEGSRVTREIVRRLCNDSNVGEPGVWRFQIRSGAVLCPEAGMPCSTGQPGVCGEGRTSCECSGASCTTSCVPQVSAGAERCNGLDDDCDGSIDEGSGLCEGVQVCDRGVCVEPCFEGGCGGSQVCVARGICVDRGCETLECPAGEVCLDGRCVGGCDGVVCPAGLACRGGRCVDACAGISCDDCTTCVDGACVTRCDRGASCPSGQTCDVDGRCVDSACVGRSCPPGSFCRAGGCVDACEGTTCPRGERCSMGACVPVERPDAGVPMRRDAGPIDPTPDAGLTRPDAGQAMDAGVDGGRVGPPPRTGIGCGCRVRDDRPSRGALVLTVLVGLVLWRRRRA